MEYVYCRVSTDKQATENQVFNLRTKYPDALIIEEIASGSMERPLLNQLIATMVKGDTLIIPALDRLGRNSAQVVSLINNLYDRGVVLKSEREGLDYSTAAGKFFVQIMCNFAEMERNIISERTKEALAVKKAQGIHIGRKSLITQEQVQSMKDKRECGFSYRVIGKLFGVSGTTVRRLCS